MSSENGVLLKDVQEYYGNTLQTNQDLQTNACCSQESPPRHIANVLSEVHDEVISKFYGCGAPLPDELEGCTVLDLGCGTGRDCYVLSKLVGPEGKVIGVDMTDQQLEVANRHIEYHTAKFGYSKPNVEFKKGYIENLKEIGIEDNSIDLIVSNCVINLSPDKQSVFKEIFRVLKPGGELYFSDVFADRRIPEELTKDPLLRGECLSGALYSEDFRRLLSDCGCQDFRTISLAPLEVENEAIRNKLGNTQFTSETIRAFKIDLEDRCEDYGQVAYYLGSIENSENIFALDDHHIFETGKPMLVCSNTARMLQQSRFSRHFRVEGDESKHFGLFDCGGDTQKIVHSTGNELTSIGGCC